MVSQTASSEECAGRAGLQGAPPAQASNKGGIAPTPPLLEAFHDPRSNASHHSCERVMGRKPAGRRTKDTSGLPDRTNGTVERNPRWHRSHMQPRCPRMRAHMNHIHSCSSHWTRNRDHSNPCWLLPYTLGPLLRRLHPNHIPANCLRPIRRPSPSQACCPVCQADPSRACCQVCQVGRRQARQVGQSRAGLRLDWRLARKTRHSRHGFLRAHRPC